MQLQLGVSFKVNFEVLGENNCTWLPNPSFSFLIINEEFKQSSSLCHKQLIIVEATNVLNRKYIYMH